MAVPILLWEVGVGFRICRVEGINGNGEKHIKNKLKIKEFI